jgi:2-keto-4-pentenoate hydratase/2-oxohepta-3-ene-1,7-dioic acid hydratase in catechol pathway
VALGMEEPKWLVAGDVVECEIPQIGILRNPIL